jgi:hypothetical protein
LEILTFLLAISSSGLEIHAYEMWESSYFLKHLANLMLRDESFPSDIISYTTFQHPPSANMGVSIMEWTTTSDIK